MHSTTILAALAALSTMTLAIAVPPTINSTYCSDFGTPAPATSVQPFISDFCRAAAGQELAPHGNFTQTYALAGGHVSIEINNVRDNGSWVVDGPDCSDVLGNLLHGCHETEERKLGGVKIADNQAAYVLAINPVMADTKTTTDHTPRSLEARQTYLQLTSCITTGPQTLAFSIWATIVGFVSQNVGTVILAGASTSAIIGTAGSAAVALLVVENLGIADFTMGEDAVHDFDVIMSVCTSETKRLTRGGQYTPYGTNVKYSMLVVHAS
ncbi:hypothetical protein LTR08_006743 [Meristemomyces frigidus]|nr:hypothetical protein LTR08_006743 [Meristemomyces frigidus]